MPDAGLASVLTPVSALPVPPEPSELLRHARARAEQDPAAFRAGLAGGPTLARYLWQQWGAELRLAGAQETDVAAYCAQCARELWLWVMGERTWEELAGLIGGGVLRRL